MRWEDERYIRWYTRSTPEWCVMPWQARGLLGLILRELDRAGILPLGKLGLPAVAVAIRAPWEEVEGPLLKLLEDGVLVHREELRLIIAPNFLDAQEAKTTDATRKREQRARARDVARAKAAGVDVGVLNPDMAVQLPDTSVRIPTSRVRKTDTPSAGVPVTSATTRNPDTRGGATPKVAPPADEDDDAPDDFGAPNVRNTDAAVRNTDTSGRIRTECPTNGVCGHSEPSLAVPSRAVQPDTRLQSSSRKPDEADRIEAEIRRHLVFAEARLDARRIAEAHAGRMMSDSQRIEDVLEAIASCAAKVVGLDLNREALQSKLVGFLWNAGKRGGGQKPTSALAEPASAPAEDFDFRAYAESVRTKGKP